RSGRVERTIAVDQHVAVAGAPHGPAEAAGDMRARLILYTRRVAVAGERNGVGGGSLRADPIHDAVAAQLLGHAVRDHAGRPEDVDARMLVREKRLAGWTRDARARYEQDWIAALGGPPGRRHRIVGLIRRNDHDKLARPALDGALEPVD